MHPMSRHAKKLESGEMPFERLTEAEYRMLKLLELGFSNKEIAEKLGITVGTTKWPMHQLLEKLQVTSRGKALALARSRGLV